MQIPNVLGKKNWICSNKVPLRATNESQVFRTVDFRNLRLCNFLLGGAESGHCHLI